MATCQLTPAQAQAAGVGFFWPVTAAAEWITEKSGYMAPTEEEIAHLERNVQRLEQNIEEREHQADPPPQSSYVAAAEGEAEVERMKEQREKIWPPDKYVKYAQYGLMVVGALFAYRLLKDFRII